MTEPCNLAKNLSKSLGQLFAEFTDLKVRVNTLEAMIGLHETLLGNMTVGMAHLSERLEKLEEKERTRARDDFQREQILDFKNADGLDTSGC